MRKYMTINFLKEEKQEEKYFKCTLIILIYILIFQTYASIKQINNLRDEINNLELENQTRAVVNIRNTKSTFIKDTNKIYELLGTSNIDRLIFENNKIYIEGQCENLNVLDELTTIENIKKFSVTNIENKDQILYFNVVCDIGGV